MSRRAYVYFVLTFVLGLVVGAAGMFFYGWYGNHWRHPRRTKEEVAQYLRKQLGLTDDQTRQVRQLMNEWDRRAGDLHKQVDPQFEAIRAQTRDEIRKLLTPAQVEKYDEILRRYDEYRRRQSHPP